MQGAADEVAAPMEYATGWAVVPQVPPAIDFTECLTFSRIRSPNRGGDGHGNIERRAATPATGDDAGTASLTPRPSCCACWRSLPRSATGGGPGTGRFAIAGSQA